MGTKQDTKNRFELAIVGGGIAGLTAGIYGIRGGVSTVVFTGAPMQSQITLTSEVENFPGFPKPTPGTEILSRIREQANRLGAIILEKAVTFIDTESRPFVLKVGEDNYFADSIVIATGAKSRKLGVPGEDEFYGKGVSVCATCDGAFFKDRVVAIVGGGDSAAAEALTLSKFAKKIYLIHRRKLLRANALHLKHIHADSKIEVLTPYIVKEIQGETKVEKLVLSPNLEELKPGEAFSETAIEVDGVFVSIGYEPETSLVEGKLELAPSGRIQIHDGAATSVKGIFAAGDVSDLKYQQAIIAAASGASATLDAISYFEQTHR